MITLYDLVFQDDRRPSPFCWRAKFALKHKGLGWRDEPMGFTEKHKIAFAQSQTVPVIHDGPKVVKDSWAIARHLDEAHPDKPLFKSEMALSYAHFAAGGGDTAGHPALFPLLVNDLYERVRAGGKPYFQESRGKRPARSISRPSRRPGARGGWPRAAACSSRRAACCASRPSWPAIIPPTPTMPWPAPSCGREPPPR